MIFCGIKCMICLLTLCLNWCFFTFIHVCITVLCLLKADMAVLLEYVYCLWNESMIVICCLLPGAVTTSHWHSWCSSKAFIASPCCKQRLGLCVHTYVGYNRVIYWQGFCDFYLIDTSECAFSGMLFSEMVFYRVFVNYLGSLYKGRFCAPLSSFFCLLSFFLKMVISFPIYFICHPIYCFLMRSPTSSFTRYSTFYISE